ncbi:MAG: tetratricopeptide repeat protein, partial [Bacteroidetes bacterium]
MSVAELTYDAQLKLLFRATVNPEEFRFILIQYNHFSLVGKVVQALKAKYPDRPMLRLKIADENYSSLIQKLTTHEGLVMIEDFNRLLDDPDMYVGFNQRRDRISRLPIQLICFLPEGPRYIRDCMEKLRDWWSIRNLVLHLRTEVPSEEKRTLEAPQEVSSLGGYNASEKKEELQRLLNRISELESTGEASELLDNLYSQALQILEDLGLYRQGLELAEKWLSKARQEGKTEVELANIYNWFGTFCQYLGEYQRAREFHQKALEIFEKNFGPDHPDTARSYSNLATVLQALG